MSRIEISSGHESIITPCVHYQFLWRGDHWKQEIVSVGESQATPRIWSIEGLTSHDGPARLASPTFQHLNIEPGRLDLAVAQLDGRSGTHHFSGTLTFEERPDEVAIDVEVTDRCGEEVGPLMATYLIESSAGQLHRDEAVTITWPNPATRLVFEARPPSRVEAHEAGMGTIRLMALAEPDPSTGVHTLHYRWRWIIEPAHQIWDRKV